MIGVVNLANGLPQVVDAKELPIGKQFVPEAIVVLQNLVCIVTRRDFNLREGGSDGSKLLSYSNSKSFKRYCILVQLREMEVFVLSNTLDK